MVSINRISEEFLADVSSVVFGNRCDLNKRSLFSQTDCIILTSSLISGFSSRQTSMNASDRHQGPSLAKLEEFKWRVDVAISTRYRSNDYFRETSADIRCCARTLVLNLLVFYIEKFHNILKNEQHFIWR